MKKHSHKLPQVTVIVTACDDSPELRRCLNIVCVQTYALNGEVILIINTLKKNFSTSTCNALEELCTKVIFEPKTGKSHALNTAIRLSSGKVIAFTDDDAIPGDDWLEKLIEPLLDSGRESKLVGSGGRVLPVWSQTIPDWFRDLIELNRKDGNLTHFITPIYDLGTSPFNYECCTLSSTITPPIGANCAYLRKLFSSYSFDPRLGPNRDNGLRGGEDTLFARQLLHDGYKIRYCPEAIVWHPVYKERATQTYLRSSYYAAGIQRVRANNILKELNMLNRPDKRLKLLKKRAKIRVKLSFLLIRIFLLKVFSAKTSSDVNLMQLLGKYSFNLGELDEQQNGKPDILIKKQTLD